MWSYEVSILSVMGLMERIDGGSTLFIIPTEEVDRKSRDHYPIGVAEFEPVGLYTAVENNISLPDSSTIKNANDENCSARR